MGGSRELYQISREAGQNTIHDKSMIAVKGKIHVGIVYISPPASTISSYIVSFEAYRLSQTDTHNPISHRPLYCTSAKMSTATYTTYPSQRPCGKLVNNSSCNNPGCTFSHDTQSVNQWKVGKGRWPCRKGVECRLLSEGICVYKHSPTDLSLQRKAEDKRRLLGLGSKIDVLDLSLPVDAVQIEGGQDLGSFKKVDDDSIAVPGKYLVHSLLTLTR